MNSSKFFSLTVLLGFLFFSLSSVHASCNIKTIGNTTLTDSVCSIDAGTVEGADTAASEGSTTNTSLLALTNSTVTINTNATLIAGSVALSGTSSVNVAASGVSLKPGSAVWVGDADADGWPTDFTLYTATAAGRRRLGLMRSTSQADCTDGSFNEASAGLSTFYQDLDGDTYGNASVTQGACSAPVGYVASSTDCYDANPATTNAELAYPGSVTCASTNRGDTSYDYNCSSTQTTCGSTYYNAVGHYLVNCAPGCTQKTSPYYTCAEGTVACGAAGYLNIGGANYWYQCGSCGGPNIYCPSIGASGTQACQ